MKVKELIIRLQRYPDDSVVYLSSDSEINNIHRIDSIALAKDLFEGLKDGIVLIPED